jgi:hypothetical protein
LPVDRVRVQRRRPLRGRRPARGQGHDDALLVIEYDPQPPFDSGSPDKADAGTMRLARRVLLGDHAVQKMAAMGLQLVGARIGRARPFKPKHRSTT